MRYLTVLILVLAVLAGCKEKNPAAIKNGELTVCYKSMLKDTVDIPLSLLTEELQILKLDDSDSALVKDNWITISDNYIAIVGSGNFPAKLFDKKTGKYIADIGAIGQGPGEYGSVYHIQIDEDNNRIYLIPAIMPSQILSYDLQGKFANDNLRIPIRVPKCLFHVNSRDSIVTYVVLPFQGLRTIAWSQKNGQVLQRYPVGNLSVKVDFSNEIIGRFNNENVFDFHIFNFFEPVADSLYHYDIENNKLIPVFTVDFGGATVTTHSYVELPQHYIGNIAVAMETKQTDYGTESTTIDKCFIVDKKSLKASYFRLKNDFLGDMEVDVPTRFFKNGYFFINFDPSVLAEQLDKTLAVNKKLSEEMRTKLTKLRGSINEDRDNNYIMYAKLKK
jgi:hypothetical protein